MNEPWLWSRVAGGEGPPRERIRPVWSNGRNLPWEIGLVGSSLGQFDLPDFADAAAQLFWLQ